MCSKANFYQGLAKEAAARAARAANPSLRANSKRLQRSGRRWRYGLSLGRTSLLVPSGLGALCGRPLERIIVKNPRRSRSRT